MPARVWHTAGAGPAGGYCGSAAICGAGGSTRLGCAPTGQGSESTATIDRLAKDVDERPTSAVAAAEPPRSSHDHLHLVAMVRGPQLQSASLGPTDRLREHAPAVETVDLRDQPRSLLPCHRSPPRQALLPCTHKVRQRRPRKNTDSMQDGCRTGGRRSIFPNSYLCLRQPSYVPNGQLAK